jgi:hypothetical protein
MDRHFVLAIALTAMFVAAPNTSFGTGDPHRLVAETPHARGLMGLSTVFDDSVLMFGGYYSDEQRTHYFGDSWDWDGTTWTQQRPARHPPHGCGMSMAYDESLRLVIMFGGEGTTGTWAWDGTTWMRIHPGPQPDNRLYPGFAYDHLRSQIVLFGGEKSCFDDYCPMRDTWTYDGTGWKRHAFDFHPSARTRAWPSMRAATT